MQAPQQCTAACALCTAGWLLCTSYYTVHEHMYAAIGYSYGSQLTDTAGWSSRGDQTFTAPLLSETTGGTRRSARLQCMQWPYYH
jgi:hypothetical protein